MKITVALAACLIVGLSSVAESSSSFKEYDLNIPRQTLDAALKDLAQQTGLQIARFSDTIDGAAMVGPVSGSLTTQQALDNLLSAQGLGYKVVNDRTIAIVTVGAEGNAKSTGHRGSEGRAAGNLQNCSGLSADKLNSSTSINGCKGHKAQGNLALARVEGAEGMEPVQTNDGESGLNSDLTSGTKVQEIIVTARKTSERLQDVPISVTVIGGAQLKERGAVDLKDVLGSVPGLAFSNVQRGQSKYNIRGVTAFGGALPTTGVYLDDVSLTTLSGFQGATDIVFFDVDRVEVLKGPQGTLFGGSAMGGAIRYVSTRPDLSTLSSSVGAGIGTIAHGSESYNAEGVVNVPIIRDVLAVRAGVYYLHEGGYVDNVAGLDIENTAYSSTPYPVYTPLTRPSLSTVSEEDYNFGDTLVGRVSLLWQPDPSWSIRPAVFVQDFKEENPPLFFTNLSGLTTSYRYLPQQTHDKTRIYSLDITKTLGAVELMSLTSYFDRTVAWNRDYSFVFGTLVPDFYTLGGIARYPNRNKVFSQELRIASATGSDARLRWVAGLYYADQTADFTAATASLFNAGLPGDVAFGGGADSSLEQYAVFGEATYRIAGRLDFTAGVRYFDIKQGSVTTSTGPFSGNSTVILSSKENGINPKFGLSYRLDDEHLLYASAAKGFRPGAPIGAPPSTCNDDLARLGFSSPPTHYESDSVWTYDLGSKNQFGGDRILINGAAFYTNWKQIQQSVLLPNCGIGTGTNAGAATIQGMEVEMQVNMTSALQVGATGTYTDAQITSPGFGSPAKKGDRILDVPEWMVSLQGTYGMPVNAKWDLKVRADYQYRSGVRRGFDSFQLVRYPVDGAYPQGGPTSLIPYGATFQESYDVVNAFAALDNGTTNVRLYVNNALDSRPYLDRDLTQGTSRAATLRPRTIGVELRQRF